MTLGILEQRVRAGCNHCELDLSLVTTQPLEIHVNGDGGWLYDARGRILCCPFCREPLDGALYRRSPIVSN